MPPTPKKSPRKSPGKSPGKSRSKKSTRRQQTLNPNAGQGPTRCPQTDAGHDTDEEPTCDGTQEKPKRRRKPSATPQPMKPTRLRTHIKETEKGQHLTNASEHRMALHQQSLSKAENSQSPESPVKEEFTSRGTTPASSFPSRNVAHPVFPHFEGGMPLRQPNEFPSQVMYHPTYGWGWIPAPFVPPTAQGALAAHYQAAEGSHRFGAERPKTPNFNLPGGSKLASPFRPELRRGPLRQASVAPENGALLLDSETGTPRGTRDSDFESTPVGRPLHPAPAPETPNFQAAAPPTLTTDRSTPPATLCGNDPVPMPNGKALADSLLTLTEHVKSISRSTGFSEEEIVAGLNIPSCRIINLFGLYRSYFLTRVKDELQRLPDVYPETSDSDVSDDVIGKAFTQFKDETPEWLSFLLDWWSIQQIATNGQSNNRPEQFERYIGKLEAIFESASALLRFETASCAAGRDIHKDQAMTTTICSPMVPNFFSDRLHISENDITAHLKAHAYDFVSRRTLPTVPRALRHQQEMPRGNTSDFPSVATASSKIPAASTSADLSEDTEPIKMSAIDRDQACLASSSVDPLENTETTEILRKDRDQARPVSSTTGFYGDPLADAETTKMSAKEKDQVRVDELKKRLFALTENCKIAQLMKPGTIQLTKLPQILAKNGWILENWSEDLPFACDINTGKGVAGLRTEDRDALLNSLKDPYFPLKVVKVSEKGIPPSEPVIIGVPPLPTSAHTHGRRRFLDPEKTTDRNGPPRLTSFPPPSLTARASLDPEKTTDRNAPPRLTSFPPPSLTARASEPPVMPVASNHAKNRKRSHIQEGDPGPTAKKVKFEKQVTYVTNNDDETSGSDESDDGSSGAEGARDSAIPYTRSKSPYHMNSQVDRSSSQTVVGGGRHGSNAAEMVRGAEEKPAIPTISVEEETYRSGLEPRQPPTGPIWFPFQHGGPYAFGSPSGMHIPCDTGHTGPNLKPSLPINPPTHRGSRTPTPQPVENQFLRAAPQGTFPPFIPRQPQAQTMYGTDARNYHITRGHYTMNLEPPHPMNPRQNFDQLSRHPSLDGENHHGAYGTQ